ncbi:serine protease 27-like [Thamnophis elegans]|uniref:serine protease 27-like n=1 Tax=Thamnophis elegans TaxID=35005 RepID=UPI001376E18D|nr:serine protease 27-like [Thamnophis elegans]
MTFSTIVFIVWFLHLTRLQAAADPEIGCKKPLTSTRIVGGQPASEGAWPWQAGLTVLNITFCGGTLIDKNWVLTAAHCFSWMPEGFEEIFVGLGHHQLMNPSNNSKKFGIQQIIPHPNYSANDTMYDIALVELNDTVDITKYILPMCLPESSVKFPDNTSCWITGWGRTDTKEIGLGQHQYFPKIINGMICAGSFEGGKDSCQGDSGGPMVCQCDGNENWLLTGIVSWGLGCGIAGVPGVYTSVAHYADWIRHHIPHITFSDCTPESNSVTPAFSVGYNTVLLLISVKLIVF